MCFHRDRSLTCYLLLFDSKFLWFLSFSAVGTSTQKSGVILQVGESSSIEEEETGQGEEEVPFRGFDSAELQKKSTACASADVPSLVPLKRKYVCPPLASFKDLKAKQVSEKAKSEAVAQHSVVAKQSLRFGEATTESELDKLSVKQFAETTDRKILWAINMFKEWRMNRLRVGPFDNTHGTLQWVNVEDSGNLLKPHLCLALCCFLNEIRRKDGKQFPGKSLYEILMCIQFFLEKRGLFWKLLDDDEFVKVKFCLDNIMKKRAQELCAPEVRSSTPISYSDEDQMWSTGVLGEESPDQLRNTVMFLLGMHLALRGGEEHRRLRCPPFNSQLTIGADSEGRKVLLYQEDFKTKMNQGGLSGRKYVPKQVKIYPNSNFDRDPVRLFEKYIGLLPSDAKSSAFYKYSLKSTCLSPVQWYADKPIGVNSLKKTVKELTTQAGLVGNFTNHSLRSTAATRMYSQGIDEQVIKEVTGHKSNAVRAYKRTSDELLMQASEVIGSEKRKEFDIDEVKLVKEVTGRVVPDTSVRSKSHKKNCKMCTGQGDNTLCNFLSNLDKRVELKAKKARLSMSKKTR